MSLKTFSKFYYGLEVSDDALYIDFNEGDGALVATMNIGSYTLKEFYKEVERALNAAGSLTYTVTLDRDTRLITISASGDFDLLIASGLHLGTSILGVIGFTGADLTAAGTYTADTPAGTSYSPQFILQSYVAPDDFEGSTYGTVNKSASGKIEVISYGDENFFMCEIKYANNYMKGASTVIRDSTTGYEDLQAFMKYLRTKAPLEFMPDEANASQFISCVLESTELDTKGMKFKLKEMYGIGLPGYFETGPLTFRVLTT